MTEAALQEANRIQAELERITDAKKAFMVYQNERLELEVTVVKGLMSYNADALEFERETDWAAYRREAAKAAMQGILSGGADWQSTLTECREDGRCEYPSEIANFAVACADELIKQLKGK